ncbi:MAG: hypothetical protein AAFO74_02060 [Pseudomonadota bacterium]
MPKSKLPTEPRPLTPFEYWRESVQVWADFSRQTTDLLVKQVAEGQSGKLSPSDAEAETLTTEFLRTLSDVNLRHWQNTARYLESLPAWMRVPNNMAGSALVDWFDTYHRQKQRSTITDLARSELNAPAEEAPPLMLTAPEGSADDLTRIKGIGPKLSSRLNEIGVFHFKQIANWSEPQTRWVEDYLAFKGRVGREQWVDQARVLSANGSTTLH